MACNKRLIWAVISGFTYGLAWCAAALDPAPQGAAPAAPAASASPASDDNGLLELPSSPGTSPPLSIAPPATSAAAPAPVVSLPAPAPPQAAAPAAGPSAPPQQGPQPTASVPPPSTIRAGKRMPGPAATAANAANAEFAKALNEVGARNPDILIEPTHIESASLMFNKSDMNVILQALDVYDNSAHAQKMQIANKDDLTSLLDSLKAHSDSGPSGAPAPLPNIYLGSIVYYSPGQWSVWVNGRKLLARNNLPTGEFYVSSLSPSEVELVWKPASLQDMPSSWQRTTDSGAHPLPGIAMDESKGTVTLHLRPNQTFLPRSLTIREGLIRAAAPTAMAASQPTPDGLSGGLQQKFPHK